MKKLISILTAFIMTASLSALIPVSAYTTDTGTCGANGGNVKWSYDSSTSTLTLSGTGATKNYIDNSEQPYRHLGAKTLIVEDGITGLGNCSFSWFTSLKNIDLPDSLINIGEQCFSMCTSLTNIKIPNSVKTIKSFAFGGCTNMETITIPNNVKNIGDYAFKSCTSLKEITIPDSVTSLGMGAFDKCNLDILTIKCNAGSYVEWLFKTYPEPGDPKIEIIGKSENPYIPTSTTKTDPITKPKTTKSEDEKASIQSSRKASRIAVKAKEAQKAMKQAKITKLKVKSKSKKTINVTWKKVKKATGYQVQVSTSKKFKKLVYDKHTSKKALKIKKAKFKSGKKYYVRVRAYAAYTNIENKRVRVYSAWNKKLRKVKVK